MTSGGGAPAVGQTAERSVAAPTFSAPVSALPAAYWKGPPRYRYHHTFHFAHAVYRRWSPVVRALLSLQAKEQRENRPGLRRCPCRDSRGNHHGDHFQRRQATQVFRGVGPSRLRFGQDSSGIDRGLRGRKSPPVALGGGDSGWLPSFLSASGPRRWKSASRSPRAPYHLHVARVSIQPALLNGCLRGRRDVATTLIRQYGQSDGRGERTPTQLPSVVGRPPTCSKLLRRPTKPPPQVAPRHCSWGWPINPVSGDPWRR